jgi:hypothetical protein
LAVKALNVFEVENLVQDLTGLRGARLQEVVSGEAELGLGLYHSSKTTWLWMDFAAAAPMLLLLSELPPFKKSKLPVALFINTHGKSLKLSGVTQREGRIVELVFGHEPDPLILEIRLFPHGSNLIVKKDKKQISFAKVKELKGAGNLSPAVASARSSEQIRKEWLGRHDKPQISNEELLKKTLKKKQEGLKKLREDHEEKKEFANYAALGEWLKENQNLKVPSELKRYLQISLNLAENIEEAFKKAKMLKAKFDEGKKRIQKMEDEIAEIEAGRVNFSEKLQKPKKIKFQTAKFRTLKLDGPFEAYLGKSGKDNLALLRQAQPWDLWLHLRDLPGAHAIIRKTKNSEVPESVLFQTIHWLVKESASKNFTSGDIVEIQMQEARFVRPLKGDTHGRVTVQEPKYRRVRLQF